VRIAAALNLSLSAFLFIDDQEFEREEVMFHHRSVEVLDAIEVSTLLSRPRMMPRFLTDESSRRRELYQVDLQRKTAATTSGMSERDFLETLGMVLELRLAGEVDLRRAEELTARTHQLNTTGYTYSYEELRTLLESRTHTLLVAQLDDRFGRYGTIGLLLIEDCDDRRTIKLFITSCRVMNRGVAGALLQYLLEATKHAGMRLCAEFVPTNRNRVMYVTYRFAGFRDVERPGQTVSLLEHPLDKPGSLPSYIHLRVEAAARERLEFSNKVPTSFARCESFTAQGQSTREHTESVHE
jgi:FkbH-like protein